MSSNASGHLACQCKQPNKSIYSFLICLHPKQNKSANITSNNNDNNQHGLNTSRTIISETCSLGNNTDARQRTKNWCICCKSSQLVKNTSLYSLIRRTPSIHKTIPTKLNTPMLFQMTLLFMIVISQHLLPLTLADLPYYSTNNPSLCPKATGCYCRWSNGKQSASCERSNLLDIPTNLRLDTQVLDISGNSLNQLASHLFQERHLTNLQKLFLSDCKISHIADAAFDQLTNLIELDLSKNSLVKVPTKALSLTKNSLRRLNLAGNPIQTIESDAFSQLTQLTSLDLNNCLISSLAPNAFRGLPQLRELKLAENQLNHLPLNAIQDLHGGREAPITTEMMGNPWHCDCDLHQSIELMNRHHIQQALSPTCAMPLKIKDIRWHMARAEDFICPPVISSKQSELVVGAGSNVSLVCVARGTLPLTMVWFQDEKNLTNTRSPNSSDPPSSTKLLEERRYEIVEEVGPVNQTSSTLYLFNLKITDTSIFLCWVENPAGVSITNFSLIVNDSPPAHLQPGSPLAASSFWRSLGISPGEAQLGIITIIFVIILLTALVLLLILKHDSQSNKNSDVKTTKLHYNNHPSSLASISGSHKFANSKHALAEREDDDYDDEENGDNSSNGSGSSCHKQPKVVNAGDLGGFIEHMRSGIINMDYHSMSPVIQFNNNTVAQRYGHKTWDIDDFC